VRQGTVRKGPLEDVDLAVMADDGGKLHIGNGK
jgi:hypothetical protein